MIVFVFKDPIQGLPPAISLLRLLKDAGETMVAIGLCQDKTTVSILSEIGIDYRLYSYRNVKFRDPPCYRIWQKLTRCIRPYLMRRWVWRQIDEIVGRESNAILWSIEMPATAILGNRALSYGRRHVVSLYELGDERGKSLWGFDIDEMYRTATLIECEYNRAHILKAEKGISRLPFVIPNKPYAHARKRMTFVSDPMAAKVVKAWDGKRVFLYQGALNNDRGSLLVLVEKMCQLFPDCVVAVMGRENQVTRRLQQQYPNFSFVPYVAPPHHLEVTSHADVGVAYYGGGSVFGLSPLNPVYCAPNKIFEYAGYGMPILCNDNPGLYYSVVQNGAGVALPSFEDEVVRSAGRALLDGYDRYSAQATKLFESVDLEKLVLQVVSFARGREIEVY